MKKNLQIDPLTKEGREGFDTVVQKFMENLPRDLSNGCMYLRSDLDNKDLQVYVAGEEVNILNILYHFGMHDDTYANLLIDAAEAVKRNRLVSNININ